MIPARRRPPRQLPMVAWLLVVWLFLWEDASVANVLAGLALGSLLVVLFPMRPRGIPGAFRPGAAAHFVGYFAWKLVEASMIVAWEVVTPQNRINEGIVAVPIRGVSETLTTLVANAISLTPGTLTLEVRHQPPVLYVHVLHLEDIGAVRRDVQYLEVLAIRAFGSSAAVAAAEAALQEQVVDAPTPSPPPSGRGGERKGEG
ncbi:MAG TPA: Na+/H+ antiporter subunit E [Acidimicrobiales bacterium]|nr:Na+/H+ antiporter subunit E [Acidimicrobiales bacterium]